MRVVTYDLAKAYMGPEQFKAGIPVQSDQIIRQTLIRIPQIYGVLTDSVRRNGFFTAGRLRISYIKSA